MWPRTSLGYRPTPLYPALFRRSFLEKRRRRKRNRLTEKATNRASRDSAVLGVGSVVNGLAAYAFVAVGVRSIGAEAFAPVALLWGFWAFSGAALAFPIQHWVIRQMTIDGDSAGVAAAMPKLIRLALAVALAQGVLSFALRGRLFDSSSLFWPLAVFALAAGTAGIGLVRGLLAGSGRYGAAASVIGGENIVRVAAAILASFLWSSSNGFAVALLLGPLAGLIWRPRFTHTRLAATRPSIRLVGSSSVGLLLSQTILHGGPVALALIDADPVRVTVLFSTLALFRAPYLVALGLTLRSTSVMTTWVESHDHRKLVRVVAAMAGAAAATAVVGYIAAAVIGPPIVSLVFGPETRPSAEIAGLVAAGSIVALAGLWLIIALIAARREATLVLSWVAGVVTFVTTLLLPIDPPATRVALAFLIGQSTAVTGMTAALIWWAGRSPAARPGEPATESE